MAASATQSLPTVEELKGKLRLSAAALSLLKRCPRHFRYAYVEGLSFPSYSPGQEKGRQFHRLVELFGQGRPIDERLTVVDPDVRRWWQTFWASSHRDPAGTVRSELPLWADIEGWEFIARLDRLVLPKDPSPEDPVHIVDWKTDRQRPKQADLDQSWQVRLYPLLVWGLSKQIYPQGIPANAIRLTLWYVNAPDNPYVLNYTSAKGHEDLRLLKGTIQELETAIEQHFPMISDMKICSHCPFYSRCYGLVPEQILADLWDLDLEAGIPLEIIE